MTWTWYRGTWYFSLNLDTPINPVVGLGFPRLIWVVMGKIEEEEDGGGKKEGEEEKEEIDSSLPSSSVCDFCRLFCLFFCSLPSSILRFLNLSR